jgi:hypothetical protein
MYICKGQEYIILNSDNDNWFLVKDKQDVVGYAPSNYLQDVSEVEMQESLNDKL